MVKKISPDPYPWKREYEHNNEMFDNQTRKFLAIINNMKELVSKKMDDATISEVFFRLTHYFERYMIQEEIYLRELGYENIEQHKQDHKEFMARIIAFREGFENGKKGFQLDMYEYLEKWFDDHMMIEDRSAVSFINESRS